MGPVLLQHGSLVCIQHIHHVAQLLNRCQRRIVRFIALRLIVDDETARTLIQDTDNDLVQNHLRQLSLHLLGVQTNHLGNVVNLHAGKRLNDLDEILLQHGVVQSAQMVANKGVAAEFVAVRRQSALVFFQGAVGVCAGNSLHGLQVLAGVLDRLLGGHELVHVVGEVEHDLAEEHVLQGGLGLGALVQTVVPIQRLNEVGECGVEVLVFGVQHAALHVEIGL